MSFEGRLIDLELVSTFFVSVINVLRYHRFLCQELGVEIIAVVFVSKNY